MSKITRIDESTFAVEGDMQVDDALALRVEGEVLLGTLSSVITVDLARVGGVGSAGISVLMCWMRKAELLGKRLAIINMPDKMYDVSRVCGLEEILRRS